MRALTILLALVLFSITKVMLSAEVVRLEWKTKNGPPPPQLSSQAAHLLPAFRIGLATLNESAVVQLCLSQPALLGLSETESAVLRPLMIERYRLIAKSPVFSKAESLLADCFQETQAVRGSANLYVPDGATANTPVILFLHGYGGSFLWYQHWLAERFPDSIILCPAYGISPSTISPEYVSESMAAASKQLGFSLKPACLIGLSAGGFGACRIYVSDAENYSKMICMAAFPPEETLSHFKKDSAPLFVAGGAEFFVKSGQLGRSVQSIRRNVASVEMKAIPGADHFFMLTHPEATSEILKKWVGTTAAKAR
ncbi:MAG: alpha/beta hydrolase [Verrucomicrobiota bacterium]